MSIMMVLLLLLEHECANVWLDVMVRSKYCHYYPHYYALFAHMSRYVLFWPHFTPSGHTPENTPKYPQNRPQTPYPGPNRLFSVYVHILWGFWPLFGPPSKNDPQTGPKTTHFWSILVFFQGTPDTPKIPLFLTTWPYVAFDPLFWVYFNPLTCLLYPIIGVLLLYMPCSVLPIYPTCLYLTSFWVYYLLLHPCNHVLHISCLRCTLRHVMFHVTCYVIICYVMSHVICSVPPVRHTHPNQVP